MVRNYIIWILLCIAFITFIAYVSAYVNAFEPLVIMPYVKPLVEGLFKTKGPFIFLFIKPVNE